MTSARTHTVSRKKGFPEYFTSVGIAAVLIFFACNRVSFAQYRLLGDISQQPQPLPPVITSLPWEKVTAPDKSTKRLSLSDNLIASVSAAEKTVRARPQPDANSVVTKEFNTKRDVALSKNLSPLPSQYTWGEVTVVDVFDLDADSNRAPNRADFRGGGRYVVIGKIAWLTSPILTLDEQRRIVKSRQDEQQALGRGLHTFGNPVAAIEQAAEQRRPTHVVYWVTDNETVKLWKKGEKKSVWGVVQKVAAFVYAEPLSKQLYGTPTPEELKDPDCNLRWAYVGVELIVKDFKQDASSAESPVNQSDKKADDKESTKVPKSNSGVVASQSASLLLVGDWDVRVKSEKLDYHMPMQLTADGTASITNPPVYGQWSMEQDHIVVRWKNGTQHTYTLETDGSMTGKDSNTDGLTATKVKR